MKTSAASAHEIIRIRRAWTDGDRVALAQLLSLVSDELHGQAARYQLGAGKAT